MAALSDGSRALPFLRMDERPAEAPWLPERREWRFPSRGHATDGRLYQDLCQSLDLLSLLPGGQRQGRDLMLDLRYGPFRLTLQGQVEAEFLSSEMGEAQRHLHAAFTLTGGWRLHWRLMAGQDLLKGAVRLVSDTWIEAGPQRSFRHLIAARALRRQLSAKLDSLGGDHGQAQDRP